MVQFFLDQCSIWIRLDETIDKVIQGFVWLSINIENNLNVETLA
jgi:hypothetical protein